MKPMSRRALLGGATAATLALAACGNGVGSEGAAKLDARVDAALNYLDINFPGTRDLQQKSVGMLVMPLITEAGFGFGGSYGRGALRVNGITVDYYSATQASFGLQIGAQQYAHVLYFMTEGSCSRGMLNTSDSLVITALSIRLRSSRILPGQR